jgi:DNA-binding response OmpR family regulator
MDPFNFNKTILLVEDDPISSSILLKILKEDGFKVTHVTDGLQALEELGKNVYDLILSDIEMPNLDGYKLLEYIQEKSIRIPVVFLSAYCSEADEIKGLELGAAEYIRKPIKREVLRLRLKKVLH